ncbi:phage head-tail connector protein [Virgibacillus halophilus]|uniref:Phage head-tail connector protein n=1 Tax=Tigheibacillus halophilus TaxID=361280 RepID=A0ABU5C630_9BACI|nr:phage head-tail connector protein [Virgibacillus halophilus]
MMIDRIKTLLDIEDDKQDKVLNIIIENVTSHLFGKLKKVNKTITTVPSELDYIIEEISIRRYNRIGTEGAKSESVEGHTISYYELDKDFTPYDEIIDDYEETPPEPKRGKVMFI